MTHSSRLQKPCAASATLLLLAMGCASTAPTKSMESSTSTMRAAQEVGAAGVPEAALHLQLAREQTEHARRLIAEGGDDEMAQAKSLLMRAQSDADLALALARESQEKEAAAQAVSNVESLRTQN